MVDGFTLVQIGLILLMVAAIWSLYGDRRDLKEENKELKKKFLKIKEENNYLAIKINRFSKHREKNSMSTEDVKEVIKYAMKAAHPDNGGKTEDFVKFNKMYQNLGGR